MPGPLLTHLNLQQVKGWRPPPESTTTQWERIWWGRKPPSCRGLSVSIHKNSHRFVGVTRNICTRSQRLFCSLF